MTGLKIRSTDQYFCKGQSIRTTHCNSRDHTLWKGRQSTVFVDHDFDPSLMSTSKGDVLL